MKSIYMRLLLLCLVAYAPLSKADTPPVYDPNKTYVIGVKNTGAVWLNSNGNFGSWNGGAGAPAARFRVYSEHGGLRFYNIQAQEDVCCTTHSGGQTAGFFSVNGANDHIYGAPFADGGWHRFNLLRNVLVTRTAQGGWNNVVAYPNNGGAYDDQRHRIIPTVVEQADFDYWRQFVPTVATLAPINSSVPKPDWVTLADLPDHGTNVLVGRMFVPWFLVTDPGHSDAWKIQNSPIYVLESWQQFALKQQMGNDTDSKNSLTVATNTGFSNTMTTSLTNTLSAEVATPDASPVSVKLGYSVEWSISNSHTAFAQQTVEHTYNVAKRSKLAVWQVATILRLKSMDGHEVTNWFANDNNFYVATKPL